MPHKPVVYRNVLYGSSVIGSHLVIADYERDMPQDILVFKLYFYYLTATLGNKCNYIDCMGEVLV